MEDKRLRINGKNQFFSMYGGKRNNLNWDGRKIRTKRCNPEFHSGMSWTLDKKVFLDFDHNEYDESFFHNHGCGCFKSASGRMKGLMVIKSDGNVITHAAIINTILLVFGEEVVKQIDNEAIEHSYIPPSEWDQLSGFKFEEHPVVTDSREWEMQPIMGLTDDTSYNKVLTFAGSHKNWKEERINLPGKFMGDQLGMSRSAVYRHIKDAIKDGYLEIVSKAYKPRHYSRTFRLGKRFIEEAGKKGISLTYCSHLKLDYIPDGEWWKRLLPQMSFFESFKEAFRWFESLPGCYARGKERLSKLRSAWRHHARNNGLDELCLA